MLVTFVVVVFSVYIVGHISKRQKERETDRQKTDRKTGTQDAKVYSSLWPSQRLY